LIAGLLFALHPVCVESVAWISEQKNTLSMVFYLSAALAWLRFDQERVPRRYVIASLWFLAALATKTVTATLPAALLVVAWWRRGRLSWRGDVLPLLPWFVAGIGAGLFTVWFERTGIGAQGGDFNLSIVERGLLAGRVFWFYLGKLAWPAELAFYYPRWDVDGAAAGQYLFPAAALALLGALVWWTRQGRGRGLLAAFLVFGGTLVPVLGFVNVYPFVFSYVADHFQYLATLPIFALTAAAGARSAGLWSRLRVPRWSGTVFAVVVVAVLSVLTWRQSHDYVDSITLYRATLARNPDSWVAHHNLGSELTALGKPAEALPHARRAVELKPDFPEALNSLADDLVQIGRAAEALPLLERALELEPSHAGAETTRGIALVSLGRVEEAIRQFQRAIELQPGLAEAHYNLGFAEAGRGNFAAAIPHFAEAVRIRPDHVEAELYWGLAIASSNRLSEARLHFDRAVELDPESAPVRQAYGQVLLAAGELEDSVGQLYEALRLNPELPGLHRDLAFALERLGRTEEARYHAAEASRSP
jgi:tetratricopeptide (TPR) repeat protein